jgi:hypothetical protein
MTIDPRFVVRLCGQLVLAISMAACVTGDITQVTRSEQPTDTTVAPGGGLVRGSIALQIELDPADLAAASAVGLTRTGLTVTLIREGSAEAPRTAVTDAQGVVRFSALLQGRYAASVTRELSATEQAQLPLADRDATLFAGGASIFLSAGANESRSVALVAARRGSIIISELYNGNAGPVNYGLGDYVEFYNNGDSTVYLDGLVFARSGVGGYHTGVIGTNTCAQRAHLRTDATHFWAIQAWTFPGTGRDFPVPPGQARVLAMDALDHATASGQPYYADLSRAHFEQYMSDADTDNPIAANMINSYIGGTGIFGRGYTFNNNVSLVIALPTNVSAAPRGTYPGLSEQTAYIGIPTDRVLDVFSYGTPPSYLEAFPHLARPCAEWINPVFDRGHFNDHRTENRVAIRRRGLGRTADGREILQRTRNSGRDIETAPGMVLRSLARPPQ